MTKCIVTGLGGRGRWWTQQVLQRRDVQIAAFVEPDATNRRLAIDQFALDEQAVHASLDDVPASVEVDFVFDITPPAVHHQIAQQVFARGLHLVQEKPLSDDFDHARRTVELGRDAGVRHMVTQNYRFHPCPRTTRRRLDEGLIGRPGQADLRFYMNWADAPGSHYVTEPFMLINDMMVHHFDLLRYVLNADPVSVQAITWNHPWSWLQGDSSHAIVFEYDDGLHATHVSVGCAVGQRTTYWGDWRIEGPGGTITWEHDRMWHTHLHRANEPVHREILPDSVPDQPVALVDEFLAAIRENRDPECCAADNLKSLAMVFAAIRSAKEKRRVPLAEFTD